MSKKNFNCYVNVTGEASDPDDFGVAGLYQINVHIDLPRLTGTTLDADAKSVLAGAVLDCFHRHQGIEVLDDFQIAVFLGNGESISEENFYSSNLSAKAKYCGQVGWVDLPEAVRAVIEPDQTGEAPAMRPTD